MFEVKVFSVFQRYDTLYASVIKQINWDVSCYEGQTSLCLSVNIFVQTELRSSDFSHITGIHTVVSSAVFVEI